MHELAPCAVSGPSGARAQGYVRALDGDVLRVAVTGDGEALRPGDPVQVVLLDEGRGECRYTGVVARLVDGTLDVAGARLVSVVQKRSAARVRTGVVCVGRVRVPWTPGRTDASPQGPAGDERLVRFTVLDVSATGMRFLFVDQLPTGSIVTFRFPPLALAEDIRATVVRLERSRSGWHHGCRFDGLSRRQSDVLYRYVLRTQGEQRRRQLLG